MWGADAALHDFEVVPVEPTAASPETGPSIVTVVTAGLRRLELSLAVPEPRCRGNTAVGPCFRKSEVDGRGGG